MYNDEIDLIAYKTTYDDLGNPENTEVRETVLCRLAEVGSNEFYSAQVADLKPELKFVVKQFEYNGEKRVEFKGKVYRVIRTYTEVLRGQVYRSIALRFDEIELTCERVIADE